MEGRFKREGGDIYTPMANSGASLMSQQVKNPLAVPRDTGNAGSITGSGRSPGGGNGNPLQYSCLENPMDGGA